MRNMNPVRKNGRDPLVTQINAALVADIEDGAWRPGDRLPGERMLAERFGVSRGTVIGALQALEENGYIDRIPSKGAFLTAHARKRAQLTRVVMPYPERSISLSALNLEQWGASTEFFHGLSEAGDEFGCAVSFRYFSETDDRQLRHGRRLPWLEDADALVFVGEQLAHLRARAQTLDLPTIVLGGSLTDNPGQTPHVRYDTPGALDSIVDFLVRKGYREVAVLGDASEHTRLKKQIFIAAALQRGMAYNEPASLDVPLDDKGARQMLAEALPERAALPEAYFFANSLIASRALYQVAWERNWRIGKDVGAIGLASKAAFSHVIPSVTHYEIPHREMGRAACRLAIEQVKEAQCNRGRTVVDGHIVVGDSTR